MICRAHQLIMDVFFIIHFIYFRGIIRLMIKMLLLFFQLLIIVIGNNLI